MIKHAKIKIIGTVQGVNFRYYAQARARALNITGFVRNEDDNSVYIEAEGEEDKLNEFLKWCQDGPASAQVDSVSSVFTSNLKNYKQFVIAY